MRYEVTAVMTSEMKIIVDADSIETAIHIAEDKGFDDKYEESDCTIEILSITKSDEAQSVFD